MLSTLMLVLAAVSTAGVRYGAGSPKQRAQHCFVINAARGGTVDETALYEALTSGKIAGDAFDVFDQEPPPQDHPLFTLPNVILSPHNAGLSKEAAIRMAISTARNALAGLDGQLDPSMIVNREIL